MTFPVFASPDHDLVPVTATNGSDWGRIVLGGDYPDPVSTIDVAYSLRGTFVPRERCVESVLEGTLQSVVAGGWGAWAALKRSLRTESYICVAGPGAAFVDVQAWPEAQAPVTGRETKYLGWNGSGFSDGPAIPDGAGNYWYRLDIDRVPPHAQVMVNCVFFAKTYRYTGDGPPPAFRITAFQGSSDSQTSIDDRKAYAFGTAPFTVMAAVGGTDAHTGTIAAKRCLDRTITGWKLAVVGDPDGVAPGRYLSFSLHGSADSTGNVGSARTAVTQRYLAPLARLKAPQIRDATSAPVEFSTSVFERFTHVVVVVRDGTACRMYLDGHLLDQVPITAGTSGTTSTPVDVSSARPLRVGVVASDDDPDHAFLVRQLGLWKSALRRDQIIDQLNSMNEPIGGDTCVGYWDLVRADKLRGVDRSATGNDVAPAQRDRAVDRQTVQPFYMQKQLETNWCWSATSTSMDKFYYPPATLRQCQLVAAMYTEDHLKSLDPGEYTIDHIVHAVSTDKPVCENGPWYDYWFYLPPPLTHLGALDRVKGPLALKACLDATRNRRPFLIRVEWANASGHFIGVAGFYTKKVGLEEVQMVVIVDPFNGVTETTFDALTTDSGYLGDGTWTSSFLTMGVLTANRPKEGA